MLVVSAQISIHPLHEELVAPAIESVYLNFEQQQLIAQVGPMSHAG